MTNEVVLVVQRTLPINITCAAGTGIEKGTSLTLSDPFTVAANSTLASVFGGIAYGEKISTDGKTKVAVIRGPGDIVKLTISGSVTVGDPLVTCSGAAGSEGNKFETAAVNAEHIAAEALETGTNGQTILAELKPMAVNLA